MKVDGCPLKEREYRVGFNRLNNHQSMIPSDSAGLAIYQSFSSETDWKDGYGRFTEVAGRADDYGYCMKIRSEVITSLGAGVKASMERIRKVLVRLKDAVD
jgi:hypothetical protein